MRTVARFLILVLLASACSSEVCARRMRGWTYDELASASDLVVIAHPVGSRDIAEESFLPDIFTQLPDGSEERIPSVGVETDFEISTVLKGPKRLKSLVLHHFRLKTPEDSQSQSGADEQGNFYAPQPLGGPGLVSFDPAKGSRYLMFLKKDSDGRFQPTGGQTDPGYFSVFELNGPAR